jgi:DNA (cytosine-5)-methyltransferase 1
MSEMRVQMVKKPTVVSLFAGCGGSSLGYKWAGYRELLAIDFDKNAVETFKLNFPSVPVWERDIKTVTGQEILEACGLKQGALDVLDGSPPCQGFSTSGRRDVNDPRNDLFQEYVRLIKEIRPRVFVMENVGGMVKGKMKGRFIEVMKTLKALPYQVKCRLMNAKNYNVPQSRSRLIWIGARNDIGKEPSFPTPMKQVISVKRVVAGLPEDPSRTLSDLGVEIWKKCRNGEAFDKYHPRGIWFNGCKVNPNRPCPTIEKTVMPSGGGGLFHWQFPRTLNMAELKRVSSFPDEFQFIGTFRAQWASIGNAVMPRFMEAIAGNIRRTVLS